MKAYSLRYPSSTTALYWIVLLAAVLFAQQTAWGAGAPSSPSASERSPSANDLFQKAYTLQKQEKFKEAADMYAKVLKADAANAEAHSNLGYCLRKQGQYDQAVSSYKKALQLNPDLAEAHEYIGEAYVEMGKFDLAEKHLAELRRLNSDEADELAAFIQKMKK